MTMEFNFETGTQIQLNYRMMQQAERDKICRYCLDNASLFDLVNEGIIVPESMRTKWDFEKLIRGCLGEGQFKCPISGCEECFETAAELRGHTRVHISAKVLVCKLCRKRFVGFCILYPEPEVAKKQIDEETVQPSIEPTVEQSVQQNGQTSEETTQQNDEQKDVESDQKEDDQNVEENVEQEVEQSAEKEQVEQEQEQVEQEEDQIVLQDGELGDENWGAEPIVEEANT